jgi:seryl-tRNA synthetase
MHDIRYIREHEDDFDAALARRGHPPVAQQIKTADADRRNLKHQLDTLRAEKKRLSAFFGQLASKGQGNTSEALEFKQQSVVIARKISELEAKEREPSDADELLKTIPNLPAADVPDGAGEEDNVLVPATGDGANLDGTWGKRREFDFEPKEHADIAPALGMDFETGALLSGARFTFLRGDMARLHRALGQFMLDVQTRENGYTECNPPVLVKDAAMYGTDKLPKFAGDAFDIGLSLGQKETQTLFNEFMSAKSEESRQRGEEQFVAGFPGILEEFKQSAPFKQLTRRWLIPTSEVPLTASVMGQILDDAALPIRLTALTQCFRSEAGAAGKDTRGFIRQHQFEKCELVSIVRPEESEAEHQRMLTAAQGILERLNLPYRTMLLCTGDMGFGARKTYDIEVWLPGQGAYREISSCSNTGEFQARRMNARYRPEGEKGTRFVHTLNGSGLAVGRTLVAVIENYQQADGSVTVPEALLPYLGGVTRLEPNT